jgi:PHP family Zn ribbon phosphoesterase
MPNGHVPFKSIVPLQEVIAEAMGMKTKNGMKVQNQYEDMIVKLGTEFDILLDLDVKTIEEGSTASIAEAIRRMRAGEMNIRPGYDGVFGKVKIFKEGETRP